MSLSKGRAARALAAGALRARWFCAVGLGCWAVFCWSIDRGPAPSAVAWAAEPVAAAPVAMDRRFAITLFAENPQLVNPTGVQVDARGRVYVIESHTHFPPKDYKGPRADRVLWLDDADGDGRADKTGVFFEGARAGMDLTLHPERGLYLVSRSAIHRLREAGGDGRAQAELLVKLDTQGDYPHNGLSGLAFSPAGDMVFGLGENLGEPYRLIGSDGVTLTGGGEGGSVYRCGLEGEKLQRVATGFWNPFGVCVDAAGEIFATDNDPDSSPPCRLLHVVPGGDYGYEFRYGRSGLHPFQCWNGELPGALPPLAGTGEAPCEIIPYDNGLLVASWADNRLEHYTLKPRGLTYAVEREIWVQGDLNFRPVGLAVAADGALYVSDWRSASYELPGVGRVWKMTPKRRPAPDAGRHVPAARNAAIEALRREPFRLGAMLESDDPFARAAALDHVARLAAAGAAPDAEALREDGGLSPRAKALLLVAAKRAGLRPERDVAARRLLERGLSASDPTLRAAALKWIADERLLDFRAAVEKLLADPALTRETLAAALAALEMLDAGKVGGALPPAAPLLKILRDDAAVPETRAHALRLLPADHAELTPELLGALIARPEPALRREALRVAAWAPAPARRPLLRSVAGDEKLAPATRAAALAGLADDRDSRPLLLELALGDNASLRGEASRALVGVELASAERQRLAAAQPEGSPRDDGVARLLGAAPAWPPASDLDAWEKIVTAAEGDAEAGARLFFHSKVAYCARCHQHEGRGGLVGPDLTRVHNKLDRRGLLIALLEPGRDMAPGYRPWLIQTTQGETLTGVALRKGPRREEYLGADGKVFSVALDAIETRRESPASLMPQGLPQTLTPQELRDLLAFLLPGK